MQDSPTAPPLSPAGRRRVLLAAMRCWRRAKDRGLAVQPSLYAQLSRHGQEMLAPAIDSLMTLFEAALGRRAEVGGPGPASRDEGLLLALLGRPHRRPASFRCSPGLAATFDHALRSARFMLGKAESRR